MRPSKYFLIIFLISALTINEEILSQTTYYGKDHFLIEGTAISESEKESPYDRLPASYKEKVRPPVWNLSKASAGITVRFMSNSTGIKVKWEVLRDNTMNHMAPTVIKGIDLYCKVDGLWQYVNTARPTGKESEADLISNMPVKMREYKMFLPLYDGTVWLEVGIDSLSAIIKPEKSTKNPIVYYGTSIAQGGCASRPGMAHTNIISRKLHTDCINFGFSGNGRMEAPIAEVIANIDALFYVIDCVPNMSAGEIHENAIPLVEIIRKKHPATPIVFVEGLKYEKAFFDDTLRETIETKNNTLKQEFNIMRDKGIPQLYYIDNKGAIGDDHEGTVDGVHFTDLGFLRFADFLIGKFRGFGLVE